MTLKKNFLKYISSLGTILCQLNQLLKINLVNFDCNNKKQKRVKCENYVKIILIYLVIKIEFVMKRKN